MTPRNPIKDKTAIVGIGSTAFSRDCGPRSVHSLALEACRKAIDDAGLKAADIDGLCGAMPNDIQAALGIPACSWWASPGIPIGFQVVAAMNAVFAGTCETVLVYHTMYRHPTISRSAAQDPFRRRAGAQYAALFSGLGPESIFGPAGYAAWTSRYLHEFKAKREYLGLIAINNRTNALKNEKAVMREPLDMDSYLRARMIRDPLCILDMDVPIDGADAFVITSAEQARALRKKPIVIHAALFGQTDHADEEQTLGLHLTGQNVVFPALWAKSDIKRPDIDLFYPYDGFSIISLLWLENAGFCGPGEAGPYIESQWDRHENRIKIDGRVPVNTHGGSLSEGGTQGSGHVREAVLQLRGEAGARQVPGARTALITPGGFFFNAQGLILRTL